MNNNIIALFNCFSINDELQFKISPHVSFVSYRPLTRLSNLIISSKITVFIRKKGEIL